MRFIFKASAWAALIMGALFLFCWHFDRCDILQCSFSRGPIPYVSSLCLLLSGLALLGHFYSSRLPLSTILGCSIFLLAFQRAVELALPADYSIFKNVHIFPAQSPLMAATGAIGFMLVGMAFIFWQRGVKQSASTLVSLLTMSLVIFLGAVGIVASILPFHFDAEFQKFFMHFYTAIGLFVIGLAVIFGEFYRGKQFTRDLPK